MKRDAEATRERILAAASIEFAERGLAGARVDRIASGATSNVRLIYAHFASKENLFALTLDRELTAMATAVPVDVDDLPGWVGRLFDYHRAHPAGVRMSLWRELERPDLGPDDARVYAEKVEAMAPAFGDRAAAIDLLVILYGMAQAWFFTPIGLRGVDGSDPLGEDRIGDHRRTLVAAASALTEAHWLAPSHRSARHDSRLVRRTQPTDAISSQATP
ncbi:TetR family transcriptional regulator [Microbacterium sp. Sa4CUA7]|uniref:TetR family transcriptional regulator n=1 Tax=Microbacterium pullorum TaxID=2762236 RepID=A0ABR8RZ63_9MICO|nr:TetR family transcriptional regulator [Microbacterium pullorum]MBD7956521.1 TetR family transcriptional regulator [Microbacterium pullorum]